MVTELDKAVVEKAVRKMNSPGFGLIRIAVNVSAASLASDDYVGPAAGHDGRAARCAQAVDGRGHRNRRAQ